MVIDSKSVFYCGLTLTVGVTVMLNLAINIIMNAEKGVEL